MANKKGGKKHKRTKKVSYSTKFPKKTNEYEDYGYVISMDGGKHCKLLLSDGVEYKGVIRGSLKKKHIFIKREGFVLVERRDFQDSKVDITFQYDDVQLDELKDTAFKSLKILVDKKNDIYNDTDNTTTNDKSNIVQESEEEEEDDFYSMINKLNCEKEIDLDDI